MVRPLKKTVIRPNHITSITLIMTLGAGILFAQGSSISENWGAGIFVLARFLDHFDGELARLQGTSSSFGYYFDYVVGGIGYAALFAGLGIGQSANGLGNWSLFLGAAGILSALLALFYNLGIDRRSADIGENESVGYPGYAGFEIEDGIYLIAPVTWLGWLMPFFVAAGISASIYCLWTVATYTRLKSKKSTKSEEEKNCKN
jgi:phosphatidylglycerophosphate synthase